MKFGKAASSAAILPGGDQPSIVLFGDSHSVAVQRAVRKRVIEGRAAPITVLRPIKEKNGETIGDISFKDFLAQISQLGPNDVVVSMIGGSQYAVFSMVRHPRPFDFYAPWKAPPPDPEAEIIPSRALSAFFRKCVTKDMELQNGGIIKGDGRRLEALRAATSAHVVHVIPPPPSFDNEHIARRHEDRFAEDIGRLGVSPPEFRLKFWSLQTRILRSLCEEYGIEVMMPIAEAMEGGYLRPEYHHGGAHANELYGELVLRSIEARYLPKSV